MKFNTSRFGEIEVEERGIIRFERGILGFENMKRYVILDHKVGSPFKFLQSLDDPDLAFAVIDPRYVDRDYVVEVNAREVQELGITSMEAPHLVYAIVTVPRDPEESTVNLKAPLIISETTGLAKQVILDRYSIRERLFPGNGPAKSGKGSSAKGTGGGKEPHRTETVHLLPEGSGEKELVCVNG